MSNERKRILLEHESINERMQTRNHIVNDSV